MGKGLFLALEGAEGAGKTTQVARLADGLRAAGLEPVLVREPGGTPLAEAARQLVLHGDHMPPEAELFLYLVARADLCALVIAPALAAGRVVIADRFELSTRAYQVAGRGLDEADVRAAIHLATRGLQPDLYVVLDVSPEDGQARQAAAGKARDRIEAAEAAFHARVAQAFRNAAGPNILHLEAGRPPETVQEALRRELGRRFPDTFAALAG